LNRVFKSHKVAYFSSLVFYKAFFAGIPRKLEIKEHNIFNGLYIFGKTVLANRKLALANTERKLHLPDFFIQLTYRSIHFFF